MLLGNKTYLRYERVLRPAFQKFNFEKKIFLKGVIFKVNIMYSEFVSLLLNSFVDEYPDKNLITL